MIKKKWIIGTLMCTILLACLTGCSFNSGRETKGTAGIGRLGKITVVTREEGSGTRSVFAESIGFYDEATGRDLTKAKCLQAESGEGVLQAVSEDPASIGYVSSGLLTADGEKAYHEVTVDGRTLERSFYLAYSGKLSEVQQDFLFYVKGAGQKIVENSYKTVHKTTSFLSSKPSGTIRIGGSSSVSGLMEEMAEDYMTKNPNAVIEVIETDSANGLTGVMTGIYDFGMSSRDLKDYEKELLEYEAIAKDEIAVIVHADNPLTNISLEDLKKIYRPHRQYLQGNL
ncbi:MAG: substrate-binding domain-containing protein [Lachnospiraceae bacterium]|nr:substrate-binding domain-containing protein [Lachnospiraceae bacterium]